MEFHVSRAARDLYQFDDALFTLTGNVIFADFHAARRFAQKMNQRRDVIRRPEQAVQAGQINAMGLIDEILHFVVAQYRKQRNPQAMAKALTWLEARLGHQEVDRALTAFAEEFPTVAVYRNGLSAAEYMSGETEGIPNRQVALEEMLMLWLANLNPAFAPFGELFDDTRLERDTAYAQIMPALREFFDTQPRFGPENQNLIDMLRAPALAHPHSLSDQLQFIATRWAGILGEYLTRLLISLDLIREENRPAFSGPGPAQIPIYDRAALAALGLGMPGPDIERYSPDRDWMPRLVLIAKNTYVWLDQLSKKHRREIRQLHQIPDEELDQLARWGITGLWLIGVWERSPASQRIKQLCGNPDALPSAYSLYDYRIANDLGGEAALNNLRARAAQRGIRLASDMVPNHMGIDSPWVINHPDWFISLPYPPFPTYSFNGPDLSHDARVGIFIEDHYYNRSDAAVVFKRLDRWTGDALYIYHGNDGTSMPWNDTAQLNYLNPEVREAVMQTILHVARQFPIIRFDAAMTLAKRHYQRLWFPEPGAGGAIPSRAGLGLTRQQFDEAMPEEFWRQVVDRVAQEAPDTLLLAEAFWLMEGYFVRTLGMHRVYNSAFMNMLRDEDNAKYRYLIKSTLEFDPQILKRYVNFMNNPDERTAVDQFGKGDKYFGICTLMATLPGLPMFGHGQIEGFAEKYGMEFRRALWDEQPDGYLISRHEHEIFPLLHRRYLFSDVERFELYDFFTGDGAVCEDVFAFSNRHGEERALVIYHNKFAEVRGWIRTSVAALRPTSNGEGAPSGRALRQTTLVEGLGLVAEEGWFTLFRDLVTGLEYIRNNAALAEQGLYVELAAYKRHVFLDFRQAQDVNGRYARIAAHLNGRGVPSVEAALRELELQPILDPFRTLLNSDVLYQLIELRLSAEPARNTTLLDDVEQRVQHAYAAALAFARGEPATTHPALDPAAIAGEMRRKLETLLIAQPEDEQSGEDALHAYLRAHLPPDTASWVAGLAWLFVSEIGRVMQGDHLAEAGRELLDEWRLSAVIAKAGHQIGLDDGAVTHALALVKTLMMHQCWFDSAGIDTPPDLTTFARALFSDADVCTYLGVNRYNNILWFNKESFERLVWWLLALADLNLDRLEPAEAHARREQLVAAAHRLHEAERASGYQVEQLLEALAHGETL
ncbi:MAG: alpha-amylase family glycosyl hydrolase [Anaerolineae bacterium]|nr:alpha-amylase family glycosyl hydrolase [Thermoflexales bacterium]MDW8406395.1 alpha-amylase family glycosyl hydrolase [Anaerolineae bacterium]